MAQIPLVPVSLLWVEKAGGWFWQDAAASEQRPLFPLHEQAAANLGN